MMFRNTRTVRDSVRCGAPMSPRAGFTLIEILIAIAIFVVVMTIVMSVFIAGLRTRAEGAANMALEREGSVILEQIMRGLRGVGGLREAHRDSVRIGVNGSVVLFDVDLNDYPTSKRSDDTTSLIYLLNGEVYYQAEQYSAETEQISGADGHVESLQFTRTSDGLDIEIKLSTELPVTDRRAFIHLTKSVSMRN